VDANQKGNKHQSLRVWVILAAQGSMPPRHQTPSSATRGGTLIASNLLLENYGFYF